MRFGFPLEVLQLQDITLYIHHKLRDFFLMVRENRTLHVLNVFSHILMTNHRKYGFYHKRLNLFSAQQI